MLWKSFVYYTDEVRPEQVIENCKHLPWADSNGKAVDICDLVREAVLDLTRPELEKDEYEFTHDEVDFFYTELELGLRLSRLAGMPIKDALEEAE